MSSADSDSGQRARRATLRWGVALSALIVLAGMGWQAAEWRLRSADTEMRERLLRHVEEMARTINPALVRRLDFSDADIGAPAFEQIREQMLTYAQWLPLRGIYSLALRDGVLVFGPENYAADDPMASPPGTVYQQPTAQVFRVFSDGRSAVIGPYRDEYGRFVSALAPVRDPLSGKVLMAVGVDVLARDWQADLDAARRLPLLATLALMLGVLGGLAASQWRGIALQADRLNLRIWVVLPTAVAMLGGLGFFSAYQYVESADALRHRTLEVAEQGRREWNRLVADEARRLQIEAERIGQDRDLLAVWQRGDLAALTAMSLPIMEYLRRERGITHLYFLEPDRTMFLRAHAPERRGDRIGRSSALIAERTGEAAWGLSSGPLGTFTLRYVIPSRHDAGLAGYLELGMEIEQLTPRLAQATGSDVVALLHKRHVTREAFERGRQALGLSGSWDDYPDVVVIGRTLAELPAGLRGLLVEGRLPARHDTIGFADAGRTLSGAMIPVADAGGRHLADLLLLRDVSAERARSYSALLLNLMFALLLPAGVVALLWSVTGRAERRLAQSFNALRASGAFHQSITGALSEAGEGVLVVDADYRVRFMNGIMQQWFGEPMGRTCYSLSGAQETLCPHCKLDRVIGQGERVRYEATAPNGRTFEIIATPMANEDGGTSMMEVLRDVTERKRTEQALQQAKVAAEAANRAKSEFLATMSHEIRTPMNAIMGTGELLAKDARTEEQRAYTETLRRAGGVLLGLIDDILDISKIEAGRLELDRSRVDLQALLDEVLGIMAVRAGDKGIALSGRVLPGTPCCIEGDPRRLRQVLINLVGNALKFTDRGQVEVSIEAARDRPEADAAELHFQVVDTGIGIPAEKHELIFQTFTQSDSSISRTYGGTGLGLAICRRLVEMMGGRIWLESEPGRGSRFHFTVRSAAASCPAAEEPAAPPAADTADSQPPRPLSILLAEDSPDNVSLVRAYLKDMPYRIDVAEDGAEAVERFAAGSYDLVLMDIQMPVFDGHEATGRIRRLEREQGRAPTPILALTAHALAEHRQQTLAAGCDAHLSKPIARRALIDAILRHTGADRQQGKPE